MSGKGYFRRMFGGGRPPGGSKGSTSKAKAQTSTETALQALHASAQDTEAKLVDVRRRIDEVDKEVKAFLQKGQRERAKVALRRKKVLEKQATSVQNNSDRIQEQILQTETQQSNIQTVMALQQAAVAGKANLKANNIEDLDVVLDDIAEQNDQMSQIQDALAQSTMNDIDDDELLAELDEIAEQQVETQLTSIPSAPQVPAQAFPAAPSHPAAPIKTAEDVELEKLLAETGMIPA